MDFRQEGRWVNGEACNFVERVGLPKVQISQNPDHETDNQPGGVPWILLYWAHHKLVNPRGELIGRKEVRRAW